MNKAFTMIEMVFVIVILGILAAVALPRLSATRDDAVISKARSDIASIRSAIISERQTRLIKGDSIFVNKLHGASGLYFDGNGTGANDVKLLTYGIKPGGSDGDWNSASCSGTQCTYVINIEGVANTFLYKQEDGTFDCNITAAPSCDLLTK